MRMTTLALCVLTPALLIPTTHARAQASANEPGVSLPDDAFERIFAPAPQAEGVPVGENADDQSQQDAASPASASQVPITQGAVDPSSESAALPAIESRPLGLAPANPTSSADVNDAGGWVRTGVALAAVIGLLLVLRHFIVRASKGAGVAGALGAGGRAPSGVLSILGRYPVARGRSLVLLQCDTRVLLLDQSSDGFRTLSEITDEREVASILMKTRDDEGASQAARFNEMLRGMESDPATLDDDAYTTRELGERVRRMRGME